METRKRRQSTYCIKAFSAAVVRRFMTKDEYQEFCLKYEAHRLRQYRTKYGRGSKQPITMIRHSEEY